MKIVGEKVALMYDVGDAAAMFSGVACPCGKRPPAVCALASGYTPMHALTSELTPALPPSPSNSFRPFVPAAINASMPPAEYPATAILLGSTPRRPAFARVQRIAALTS